MKSRDRSKSGKSKGRDREGAQPLNRQTPSAAGGVASAPASVAPAVDAALRLVCTSRRVALLLAAMGVAVYCNSFHAPFVYDGVAYILENASIRQLNPLALTEGQSRPVSYYSFALNYAVGGYNVWGYHAVNLAIHVAAAWTLFGLVRRTLESAPRCAGRYDASARNLALAIAALWLVHPLQTASVTYIYQRQESLMGLLYLLTLYGVLRGVQATAGDAWRSPQARRVARKWYVVAVVCSLTGMGTKEVMVTAPLMTLWYDRAFWAASWRELWDRRKWLYAALGATAAIPFVVLFAFKEKYQSVGLMVSHVYSPWEYARSQPGVICHYLWLCIDPHGLCLDPNWPKAETAAEIWPPAVLVGLLLGLTAWGVWKRPAWGFVGAWFFVILSPTSSVVPILDLAYDHRMYLSLASVMVVAVIGLYETWRWLATRSSEPLLRRAWVLPALFATAVVAFGVETQLRNDDYRTGLSIWQDAVDKAPHNARAHYSVGRDLHELADGEESQEEEALAEARRALEIVPKYPDARNLQATVLERIGSNLESAARYCENEGAIAEAEGRFDEAQDYGDEAQRCYDEAAKCYTEAEGDFKWAIENGGDKADGWTNLGNLFARQRQFEQAMVYYDRALECNSKNALALKNRGSTLLLLNKPAEGARDIQRAIELDDKHSAWYFMLAVAQATEDKPDEAIQTLRQAVSRGLVSADIYSSLGALLAKKKRWSEAEAALQQSLKIDPASVPALMNLADLLVERGRKAEAIDCYRRVLAIRPRHAEALAFLEKLQQPQADWPSGKGS